MNYVGVMTGTSVDGLDLALIDPDISLRPTASYTAPFPNSLRTELIELASNGVNDIERLGAADVALGQFTAQTVNGFLADQSLKREEIRAIGNHGQTVRHAPNETYPFTLQIGDANVIAERTGIDVIADFRRRDIAAGGQGAPLVPDYHQRLFGKPDVARTILNIGGIANVSLLSTATDALTRGFDTGPGNALVDAWAKYCDVGPYDVNGDWARLGQLHKNLLGSLLRDPYYAKQPPKSTGKEHFNLEYIKSYLTEFADIEPANMQATLTELTAGTIVTAVKQHAPDCAEVIVCGGGRKNLFLMERLKALINPVRVWTSEDLDIDGDAIEAAAFGYLAWCFVNRRPGNVPTVTGATGPRVLGCLFPA